MELLIALVPVIALAIRLWFADRAEKRAQDAASKARLAEAQAKMEAELERLATKAVVTGVMKLKERMSPSKKEETNNTIRAITEELGVENLVHAVVEEVKKEKKDAAGK